jgi:hypothetical protein
MSYYSDAVEAFRRGDTQTVARLSAEELDRARTAGDDPAEVAALCMLARVAVRGDDLPAAKRLAGRARAVALGTGERALQRAPVHILAGCARIAGELEDARALYGESIAISESVGDAKAVTSEQHNLGYIELHAGDVDRARERFAAARRQVVQRDDQEMLPYVAVDAAVMAAVDGGHVQAARLLAAAQSALRARGQVLDLDDAIEQEALRERLLEALGPAPAGGSVARGSPARRAPGPVGRLTARAAGWSRLVRRAALS